MYIKDSQVVNRHLKTIARSLNVRDKVKREISIHMARHTFASIMVRKVDVEILQKLMQHSNIRETMIYVHLFGDAIDQALDDVRW